MPVAALKEYAGKPLDVVANFHGRQLLYIVWDKHLMYAAPAIFAVEPGMKFGDVLTQLLAPVIKDHPDAPRVDWGRTEWELGDRPWTPDLDRTVAENGLVHKAFLRFRTPGLDGYKGLGI